MEFNINIIGFGYVGTSIAHLCNENGLKYSVYDKVSLDIIKERGQSEGYVFDYFQDLRDLVNNNTKEHTNVYFICVPTPSTLNGDCDVSIINNLINNLSKMIKKKSIIIIKSTVKPTTCNELTKNYPELDLVFCPEFLRELTYKDDIYNSQFIMFGANDLKLKSILNDLFLNFLYKHKTEDKPKIIYRKFEEAELFKYTVNTFLATKITFFNEIYELCEKLDIDYQEFKTLFPLEPRIGCYGVKVPGDDGKYGFGLSCLPKELASMIQLRGQLGLDKSILEEIKKKNDMLRK